MSRYIALLRGINVGGKSPVPMAPLRALLEELGFTGVSTYIASGNVVFDADLDPVEAGVLLEQTVTGRFAAHAATIRVLVLRQTHLQAIVDSRPDGFGGQPDRYHSDVVFLMGIEASEAMTAFDPRPGVDTVWPGDGVVYSQRRSAERTRSRLNKVMSSPLYTAMTIRNWATTTALLDLSLGSKPRGRA